MKRQYVACIAYKTWSQFGLHSASRIQLYGTLLNYPDSTLCGMQCLARKVMGCTIPSEG